MKGWRVHAVDEVDVTYRWAAWEIVCTWPQRFRRSDVVSIVSVRYGAAEDTRLVLSPTRINLLSASAKTSLAATLRRVDEDRVAELVNHVCANLLDYFAQSGETTTPTPRIRDGDRWLLYPLWPATGGTLVAAGTNSFKSLIGVAAAVQATCGVEVLAGNTRATTQTPVLFCDWEGTESDFAERLYAVLRGAGMPEEPCVAYRHLRIPLVDAADTLADEIARRQYGGVVIDSLSAAAGGSLVDDELANQFWGAVSYLDVPALVMAHKSADKLARRRKGVFGSVMHENRSRMLWDAVRSPEESSVRWEVVSDNNTGRKGKLAAWRIDITTNGHDQNERLDSISFEGINPHDFQLAAKEGDTWADRMSYAIIEQGSMTSDELATAVGTSPSTVRKVLSRHSATFGKHADGVRWMLKNDE